MFYKWCFVSVRHGKRSVERTCESSGNCSTSGVPFANHAACLQVISTDPQQDLFGQPINHDEVVLLRRWWQLPYYWFGIKAYDLVSGSQLLKSSYLLSKSKAIEHFPMLKRDKLVGAIVYYDGETWKSVLTYKIVMALKLLHLVCLLHRPAWRRAHVSVACTERSAHGRDLRQPLRVCWAAEGVDWGRPRADRWCESARSILRSVPAFARVAARFSVPNVAHAILRQSVARLLHPNITTPIP